MLTEEKVRDAASAQILKAEHEATKAEIEAREDSFKLVIELGEALVQGGHYAAQVSSFIGFFILLLLRCSFLAYNVPIQSYA